MLEKDAITMRHDGCPNRHHCKKDETKCCYLVQNKCIIEQEEPKLI